MFREKGAASLENSQKNRGINSESSRILRTYLSEAALAMYFDRFARLNRNYDRSELEAVERIWVLRAIDERWQRHLVEMQVLRNSVNVRAFGQLDPMEEYRIDGARAFVDMVRDLRRKTIANVFFFVGSAVEPTLDFEMEEMEEIEATSSSAAVPRPGRTAIGEVLQKEQEKETVAVDFARRNAPLAKREAAVRDLIAEEVVVDAREETNTPSQETDD